MSLKNMHGASNVQSSKRNKLLPVKLGVEKGLAEPRKYFKDYRLGLICNQASVDHNFRHIADLLFENKEIDLRALFGPQHGIRGDVQDNMVETAHKRDKKTGLPIYSLYSETREPTERMLEDLDALVFDLQDVGCRVYTFIYTMANAMRSCAAYGKKMYVLDRPNPIGGAHIEGNILEKGHESFVGQFPIPMRHGMTIGEIAALFNKEFGLGCELEVIRMDGWERGFYLDETDAPWVMPSPNMPTVDTAAVFPGTVFFEGTKISEGRGTTRPFEIIGAPFINADAFAEALNELGLPGVIFRATEFLPTFQKHAGKPCGGVFLHVTDRSSFQPVDTGVVLVKMLYDMYSDDFAWKDTPYEYEYDRNPFDVIAGSMSIREMIETGTGWKEITHSWSDGLLKFQALREQHLMY